VIQPLSPLLLQLLLPLSVELVDPEDPLLPACLCLQRQTDIPLDLDTPFFPTYPCLQHQAGKPDQTAQGKPDYKNTRPN